MHINVDKRNKYKLIKNVYVLKKSVNSIFFTIVKT